MAPDRSPRVLMVHTAFLGDVILATPLIAALRRRFPHGHLAFMGAPAGCGLIQGLDGVDEFLVFDKRGADQGWRGGVRRAADLNAQKYDIGLGVHRSLRTALLLARARIPRRIGFATSPLPWLYPERVPWEPAAHEVERNLALMAPLGGRPAGFTPRLALPALPPADGELLPESGPGPRVGLCPGSVWPTKRWPARGFARVAEALAEDAGAQVYLIGSEADREVTREVASLCRGRVWDMAGKTSLRDWVRLMAAMDLIVTNDSAPTHIASALSVPVAVIYGPTTPALGFAPWAGRSAVVEAEGLACRPCGKHGSRRCPEGHFKCMELLPPATVIAAALQLLPRGP